MHTHQMHTQHSTHVEVIEQQMELDLAFYLGWSSGPQA